MSSLCPRLTLLVMLLCIGGCTSTGTAPVSVPTADPQTAPDVVLDVHFPQGPILTVTPTGNIPEVPTQLNGNDEISLVALCTDNDSGCRNIEIFADASTFNANNTAGTVASSGPPVAQNLDAAAKPGGTANQKLNANIKLSVPQLRGTFAGLKVDVSARATNAHTEMWNTKKVSLFWNQQSPLTLPPCPRFGPIGSDPPVVLDSRQVTIAIQNAKAANPAKTTFTIGVVDRPAPNTRHAWQLNIAESSLPPTTAGFTLVDATGTTLSLLTVDGRSCNTAGTLVTAAPNSSSVEAIATTSNTTTIVLTSPNHGPLASGTHDDAVFNEATFWRAFGGKRTTITWIR
jgi:hypothetical protein